MRMPPRPEPSHTSALANAGMERAPSTSAAMSFRATMVIQLAPNAIISASSATKATAHDERDSIDDTAGCGMGRGPAQALLQGRQDLTTRTSGRAAPHLMRK